MVFGLGLAMFASGILQMLSPTPEIPDYSGREKPDSRPSYLFDGPVNTTEQGGPIPLIYGEVLVGSTIISTSLDVEDI
jgi:predicted phage tail protein